MNDLGYGLIIGLFGMVVVLVVLIGLAFLTSLMGKILNKGNQIAKGKNIQIKQESQQEREIQFIKDSVAKAGTNTVNGEVLAAISAAIAAYTDRETDLVVRSVRRIEDYTPVWGKVSRQEQMLNRL